MQPKFKVGDIVTLLPSISQIEASIEELLNGKYYDPVGFVRNGMSPFLGRQVTIANVAPHFDYVSYEIEEDGRRYWWNELYFENEAEATYDIPAEELLSIINH